MTKYEAQHERASEIYPHPHYVVVDDIGAVIARTSYDTEADQKMAGAIANALNARLVFKPLEPQLPNIRKFLDVSTAHISAAAKIWLQEGAALNHEGSRENGNGAAMGTLGATLYGWFMTAPGDDSIDSYGMPDDLIAICDFAKEHDCYYILFDADADLIDALPVYDFGETPVTSTEPEDGGLADELAEPEELDITAEKLESLMSGMAKTMFGDPEPDNIAYGGKIDDYLSGTIKGLAPGELILMHGKHTLTATGIARILKNSNVSQAASEMILAKIRENAEARIEQRRMDYVAAGNLTALEERRLASIGLSAVDSAAMAELRTACNSILDDVEAEIEQRQAGMDGALWTGLRAKADRLVNAMGKVYR